MPATAVTPTQPTRQDAPAPAPSPRAGARRGTRTPARRRLLTATVLILGLVLASVASLAFGTRQIDPATVLSFIGSSVSGTDASHTGASEAEAAVLTQRSVRTLWALVVGAALGLAGAGLQGITRNPLGDPAILGINAGAAFAVVAGISFFAADSTTVFALYAFAGAIASAIAVYALASIGSGGATPIKLALMGAALTAGLGSGTSAMILTNQNTLDDLRRWQIGSVAGATMEDLFPAGLLLALGAVIVLTGAKTINSFALGDDMAASLGENVAARRLVLTAGVTLLVGTAVALTGPIGFLGLMAPHAMRALVGADYRYLLPLSALTGAVLLTVADTVGRVILPPQEMQVGVMMVALGVPVFIYLVRRGKAVNL